MKPRFFYYPEDAKETVVKMKKQCSGFTIMELMVSMLAMAVLALAVGSMLFYGWLGWRRNTESVNMQRDAVIAMNVIAREIRNSNITEVSGDSTGVQFTPLVVRTNSMAYLANDIAYTEGVGIRNFSFSKNVASNTVTVAFTLFTSSGTDQNDYAMTINPRN